MPDTPRPLPANLNPNAFREQISFLLAKENIPTAGWTDVWKGAHDTGFVVAGAYQAELLSDLRGAVERAITESRSLAQFRAEFDQIVQRHGWSYNGGRGWRTRLIYETNLQTSYQAGRYAQLTDPALLRTRPFWRYSHSDFVQHPRVQHLAWDNLVLRYDDPWWQTHYPPNGWGCRCTVYAESRRTLEAQGLSVGTAPPIVLEDVTVGVRSGNPRTVRVPQGIDPGWDYAPGARVAESVRGNPVTAPQTPARAAAADLRPKLPEPLRDALDRQIASVPAAPPAPRPDFRQPPPRVDDVVPDFGSPVQPDVSTPARRAAVEFENRIRNELREHGAFFDAEGRALHEVIGEFDRIGVEERILESLRGSAFSHNHPGGLSFSVEDVILAATYGLVELRVVTDRLRYSLTGLDQITDRAAFAAVIQEERLRTNADLAAAVRFERLNLYDFDLYSAHVVWQRVARRLRLNYRREVS